MSESNPSRFLEPDLQPQALVRAIVARQTVWDRQKHAIYFEAWGCRDCKRKDVPHGANGYCRICHNRLHGRYRRFQRKWEKDHPLEQAVGVDPKSDAVKRLLGKLGYEK